MQSHLNKSTFRKFWYHFFFQHFFFFSFFFFFFQFFFSFFFLNAKHNFSNFFLPIPPTRGGTQCSRLRKFSKNIFKKRKKKVFYFLFFLFIFFYFFIYFFFNANHNFSNFIFYPSPPQGAVHSVSDLDNLKKYILKKFKKSEFFCFVFSNFFFQCKAQFF